MWLSFQRSSGPLSSNLYFVAPCPPIAPRGCCTADEGVVQMDVADVVVENFVLRDAAWLSNFGASIRRIKGSCISSFHHECPSGKCYQHDKDATGTESCHTRCCQLVDSAVQGGQLDVPAGGSDVVQALHEAARLSPVAGGRPHQEDGMSFMGSRPRLRLTSFVGLATYCACLCCHAANASKCHPRTAR